MNKWIEGARPKTLVASIAPVLVGTAAARKAFECPKNEECARLFQDDFILWRFLLALIVALALQVAVNYANDYFDGRRGVDTTARIGPRRLTATGDATHTQMKVAIALSLLVAAVAGLTLALATSLWILALGLACFLALLGYSGGPKPYGAAGLGEFFVFVFFGIVATIGSTFVQIEQLPLLSWLASIPVGLLAVSILVVNNLRDIETDAAAGKRTLAVRLGRQGTRRLYRLLILLAFGALFAVAGVASSIWPLLPLLALQFVVKPTMLVGSREDGPGLIQALVATARLQLIFGVLLAAGLWIR